jgi:hypothetical protein
MAFSAICNSQSQTLITVQTSPYLLDTSESQNSQSPECHVEEDSKAK